ncbi:hypothetical protein Btru_057118 [Bulinus truncatus]|nr:hypothetical protein Btru_057118 [Bulinus truncatus]
MCPCIYLIQWGISQFLYLQSKKGTLNLTLLCPALKDVLLLSRQKDSKCFEQSTPSFSRDWLIVKGHFKVYQAKLFLYIPDENEHINDNKTSFTTFDDITIWHEIEILQKLSHPDIITLFAFNKHSTPEFYILEDFEDKCANWQQFLVNRHRNSILCKPTTLFKMTLQALKAIEFCHFKKIMLRNINTRSFKVDNRDNIKLKNFKHARQLQQPTEEISVDAQDNKKILIRWSAPECIRRSKWSLKSDVWQVGHLIIEVNTHGGIPYPEVKLNDPDIAVQVLKLSARSQKQINIGKELFKIAYLCLSGEKHKRPDLPVIISKLHEININNLSDGDIVLNETYPKGHLSYEKLTEKLERGIASIDDKLFDKGKLLSTVYLGNLFLYKEKTKCIFQQTLQRKISSECLKRIKGGELDCVLPFLKITSNETLETHIVDIVIPSHLNINVAELIRKKTKTKAKIPLEKVFRCMAEILDKLHNADFLIGIVTGSHFFFENSDEGDIWVHLASIANVSLKSDKTIHELIISSLEGNIRLPPELKQSRHFSTQSDVYSFASAILNLCRKNPTLETVTSVSTDNENQEPAHLTAEFVCQTYDMKIDQYQCLHHCLDDDPYRRPSVADIIKIFSTEEEIALNEPLTQKQVLTEIITGDTNAEIESVINPSTHHEHECMEHHLRLHSSLYRRQRAVNNLYNTSSPVEQPTPNNSQLFMRHSHWPGHMSRETFLPYSYLHEGLNGQCLSCIHQDQASNVDNDSEPWDLK